MKICDPRLFANWHPKICLLLLVLGCAESRRPVGSQVAKVSTPTSAKMPSSSNQPKTTKEQQLVESHFKLAQSLRQVDLQASIDHYRAAISARPDFVDALYNLGVCLIEIDDLRGAREQFAEVDAIEPGHANANYQLGSIATEMYQFGAAVVRFRKAIESDPGHADALEQLGAILVAQGEVEAAITYLENAAQLRPNDARLQADLGAALLRMHREDEAIRLLEKATRLDDANIKYKLQLAAALLARKSPDDLNHATALATRAVQSRDTRSAEAGLILSRCLLEQGDRAGAIAAAEFGLQAAKDDANAAVAASCHELLGQIVTPEE